MGFGLICKAWASLITHNRPLGRADWAFILHPELVSKRPECFNGHAQQIGPSSWAGVKRLECFNGHASPLGFSEGACEPIFQTLSVAPQPLCTACVGKGCNVSRIGCNFHVSAWAGLVKA